MCHGAKYPSLWQETDQLEGYSTQIERSQIDGISGVPLQEPTVPTPRKL